MNAQNNEKLKYFNESGENLPNEKRIANARLGDCKFIGKAEKKSDIRNNYEINFTLNHTKVEKMLEEHKRKKKAAIQTDRYSSNGNDMYPARDDRFQKVSFHHSEKDYAKDEDDDDNKIEQKLMLQEMIRKKKLEDLNLKILNNPESAKAQSNEKMKKSKWRPAQEEDAREFVERRFDLINTHNDPDNLQNISKNEGVQYNLSNAGKIQRGGAVQQTDKVPNKALQNSKSEKTLMQSDDFSSPKRIFFRFATNKDSNKEDIFPSTEKKYSPSNYTLAQQIQNATGAVQKQPQSSFLQNTGVKSKNNQTNNPSGNTLEDSAPAHKDPSILSSINRAGQSSTAAKVSNSEFTNEPSYIQARERASYSNFSASRFQKSGLRENEKSQEKVEHSASNLGLSLPKKQNVRELPFEEPTQKFNEGTSQNEDNVKVSKDTVSRDLDDLDERIKREEKEILIMNQKDSIISSKYQSAVKNYQVYQAQKNKTQKETRDSDEKKSYQLRRKRELVQSEKQGNISQQQNNQSESAVKSPLRDEPSENQSQSKSELQVSSIKNFRASTESLINSKLVRESKVFATNDKQCVILDKAEFQNAGTLISSNSIREGSNTLMSVSRSNVHSIPGNNISTLELSASKSPPRKRTGDFGSCLKYIPKEEDNKKGQQLFLSTFESLTEGPKLVSPVKNDRETIRKWTNLDVVQRSELWIEGRKRKMDEMKKYSCQQEVEPCTFKPKFFTKDSKRWKHRSVYATPYKENPLKRSGLSMGMQSPQDENIKRVSTLVSPRNKKTDFAKITLSQNNIPGFNDKWYHQRSYKYSHDIRKKLVDENSADNQNKFALYQTSSHSSINQGVSSITAKDLTGYRTERTVNGVVNYLEEEGN